MNPIKTLIVVKSQFEGIHSWPDCPHEDVSFLRHPHRHVFHVTLKIKVSHDDRELEFIKVKRELENALAILYYDIYHKNEGLGSKSCEMIAKEIGSFFASFPVHMISVFEDNESGAEVYFS